MKYILFIVLLLPLDALACPICHTMEERLKLNPHDAFEGEVIESDTWLDWSAYWKNLLGGQIPPPNYLNVKVKIKVTNPLGSSHEVDDILDHEAKIARVCDKKLVPEEGRKYIFILHSNEICPNFSLETKNSVK